MAVTNMRIQVRRDDSKLWEINGDNLLLAGEIGYEVDTNLMKVGDGNHSYNELDYFAGGITGLTLDGSLAKNEAGQIYLEQQFTSDIMLTNVDDGGVSFQSTLAASGLVNNASTYTTQEDANLLFVSLLEDQSGINTNTDARIDKEIQDRIDADIALSNSIEQTAIGASSAVSTERLLREEAVADLQLKDSQIEDSIQALSDSTDASVALLVSADANLDAKIDLHKTESDAADTTLTTELNELKTEFVLVQGDVTTLQGDVVALQGRADVLEGRADSAEGRLDTIEAGYSADMLTLERNTQGTHQGNVIAGGDPLTANVLVDAANEHFYGELTGNVTGNVAGTVKGDVVAADDAVIVDHTNKEVNATKFTGRLEGISKGQHFGPVFKQNTESSPIVVLNPGLEASDIATYEGDLYKQLGLVKMVDSVAGTFNGDITGNVTGNLTGDVIQSDGSTVVVDTENGLFMGVDVTLFDQRITDNATAISTEEGRATAAEGANATAIAAEEARALAAEGANATAITAEETRATAAETANATAIAEIADGTTDLSGIYATNAQGVLAVSALQPGANISELNNNSGFVDATAAAAAAPVQTVAGRAGTVTLTKADVGLDNVDNTADSAKPVSTVQQTALDGKVNKVDLAVVGVTAGSAYDQAVIAAIIGKLDDIVGALNNT